MTVAKVIELVGESKVGWEDAVKNAIEDASRTVENMRGVEVYNWTASIDNGKIVDYKANIKVAFGVNSNR
ncbi:MAG: dodecin domain-containing protein [Clostridiales bacterium]|jgi:flavin-binding protein dodecin|nr:dodecin domain-containing protein [Clostridiales bacterium]